MRLLAIYQSTSFEAERERERERDIGRVERCGGRGSMVLNVIQYQKGQLIIVVVIYM